MKKNWLLGKHKKSEIGHFQPRRAYLQIFGEYFPLAFCLYDEYLQATLPFSCSIHKVLSEMDCAFFHFLGI